MSFQPLTTSGGDNESVSERNSVASNHQLICPDPERQQHRNEQKRKTYLAASIFFLIVFVTGVVSLGLFYMTSASSVSNSENREIGVSTSSIPGRHLQLNSPKPTNRAAVYAAQAREIEETKRSSKKLKTVVTSTNPTVTVSSGEINFGIITGGPPKPSTAPPPNHPSNDNDTTIKHSPTLISSSVKPSIIEIENAETGVGSEEENSSISSKSKRSRKSQRRNGPPELPPNFMEKNPISLLYEMDLNPKFEFLQCLSNIQQFKTILTLKNTKAYVGYGIGKRKSKTLAAQLAVIDTYHPNSTYPDMPNNSTITQMATSCGLDS